MAVVVFVPAGAARAIYAQIERKEGNARKLLRPLRAYFENLIFCA